MRLRIPLPSIAKKVQQVAPDVVAEQSGMLNPFLNPEEEPHARSYARNKHWSVPDYKPTQLSPSEEQAFQSWGRRNPDAIRGELTPDADYDIRGYWKALTNPQDPNHGLTGQAGNGHYSDFWKTPYSGVFSKESMYATPDAPSWNGDSLYTKDGKLVTGIPLK
jgi:hypothetical protein